MEMDHSRRYVVIVSWIWLVTLVFVEVPVTVMVYVVLVGPVFPDDPVPALPPPQAVSMVAVISPAANKRTGTQRDDQRDGNLRFLPTPSKDKPKTPASAAPLGQFR